jgi:hypothetical protein
LTCSRRSAPRAIPTPGWMRCGRPERAVSLNCDVPTGSVRCQCDRLLLISSGAEPGRTSGLPVRSKGIVQQSPCIRGDAREARVHRPPNVCDKCYYRWHPRGHNRSLRCPKCGSTAVSIPVPPPNVFIPPPSSPPTPLFRARDLVYPGLAIVILGSVCTYFCSSIMRDGSSATAEHDAGVVLAVAKKPSSDVVVATTALRVRAEASAASEPVASVPAGTHLVVLERARSWIKVQTPTGDVGFVYAPLVSRETQ